MMQQVWLYHDSIVPMSAYPMRGPSPDNWIIINNAFIILNDNFVKNNRTFYYLILGNNYFLTMSFL